MERLLNIVHEDEELLVINKPAGLVCHPTKGDAASSLAGRVRLHLGEDGAVRLINRLDRETSGIVVVAKNAAVARELGRLWENRNVHKEYLAIVHGHLREDAGIIDAPLAKDENSRVAIKDCVRSDGAPARTEYRVERRFTRNEGRFTLVRVFPRSGRKHQIRIHLQHISHPIVGDKIYGGDENIYLALVEGRLTVEQEQKLILTHHALHAALVSFDWRKRFVEFTCEPETGFREFHDGSIQAG